MLIAIVIVSISVTTAFASNEASSSPLSNTKAALNENAIPQDNPPIADKETNSSLYTPVRSILERLNYGLVWEAEPNTINLISNAAPPAKASKTEISKTTQNTQKISIDVKSIKSKSYIEIGEFNLSAGDNINFNIEARGYGLSIGFVKSTDIPTQDKSTYFEQRIYSENAPIKSENVLVPAELEGEYKLFVRSVGEKQLADIKGTVQIIKGNSTGEKGLKTDENTVSENIQKPVEYKKIDLDISNTEKALIAGKDTPMENYYYYAFDPYLCAGNIGETVIFDVQNGVSGSMFIGTSPNKEVNNGVNNTFTTSSAYKGSIDIFADNSGYYYVIIGAKDIKGSIQVPIYN